MRDFRRRDLGYEDIRSGREDSGASLVVMLEDRGHGKKRGWEEDGGLGIGYSELKVRGSSVKWSWEDESRPEERYWSKVNLPADT